MYTTTAIALVVCLSGAPAKAPQQPAPPPPEAAAKEPPARPKPSFSCSADEFGYCTDKRLNVPLDPNDREVHLAVNTALSDVLVIWLPAGATVPKCRKPNKEEPVFCLDLGNTGAFAAEVQELEGSGRKQTKVTIRPFLSDAAKAEWMRRLKTTPGILADDIVEGERSNIQFSVADRWAVSLDVVIQPPEKAVRQIFLLSKEFESETDELGARCEERARDQYRKMQDAWSSLKSRAQEETAAELAYSVLKARRCRFKNWTAFKDQVWVQIDSVCEIGTHRFLVFRLRNRAGGGDLFRPGEVAVLAGSDEDPKHIASNVVFARERELDRRLGLEDVELAKDDEVVGTVHFAVDEAPSSVMLRITEAGGRTRQIVLDDISL